MIINSKRNLIEVARRIVCEYHRIDNETLDLKIRKREIVEKRQTVMAILKRNTKLSLWEIGCGFGDGMDHATVVHAQKAIKNLCETNNKFKAEFEMLEKEFINQTGINNRLLVLFEKIRTITNKRFWKNIYLYHETQRFNLPGL